MSRIKYKEAAGFEVKRGRASIGPTPTKDQLMKLYVLEDLSVRDVATALACSKDAVHRALKLYGIEARPCASRSKLRTIPHEDLEAGVNKFGVRGYAQKLDVSMVTLYRQLKTRKVK